MAEHLPDAVRKLADTAIEASKALVEANEVLRSCYQVAARGGVETNWPALKGRILDALKKQNAIIHPKD